MDEPPKPPWSNPVTVAQAKEQKQKALKYAKAQMQKALQYILEEILEVKENDPIALIIKQNGFCDPEDLMMLRPPDFDKIYYEAQNETYLLNSYDTMIITYFLDWLSSELSPKDHLNPADFLELKKLDYRCWRPTTVQ